LPAPSAFATEEAVVAIGPEGDFSEREVALALSQGFEAISMGTQVLRSETAALYAAVCYARGL
jgi:16S rRNA (uracil1498-N3)-methyltransferase